ncbi:branched-chain amino acid ABC transporter [Enterococcus florum]|uniref:Branched-chain amino acid ABC transporter n=1 Tax=Enterococcus florum TaxID=2480627 RepID=A0A4P5P533_9ENTE|nr:AzlC family ABC transporter permease [Enterococcus florum]GCF92937.1 branched-chain amino acid ABC transporter [Enterococcus florum]
MFMLNQTSWKQAFTAVLPLCLSYLPVGLACGMLLQKVGFTLFLTGLLSLLVFSGGAQFLIVSLLAVHASFSSIILMVFFLELRYALLGSSLSYFFKQENRGFLAIFSQSMNDENYAVNYLHFSTDVSWTHRKALMVNWLSLLAWTGSTLLGTLFGSVIAIDTELVHFALTAMFIFMFMMQLKNRLLLMIGLLSGLLAVLFVLLLKNTFGLILATVLASLIGYFVERNFTEAGKKLPAAKEEVPHE